VIFGVTAGVLGGISMMIQKIFVTPVLGRGLSAAQIATALATSRLVYIFIVVSMGAFVMVQVAYQFGRAIQVIPATVSAMILTPVMGGILVFGEIMTPWQSAGTIFIVVGVILLSAFNKESKVAAEAIPAP
jgi:drug/metabolite transporter (DMT)-like permease